MRGVRAAGSFSGDRFCGLVRRVEAGIDRKEELGEAPFAPAGGVLSAFSHMAAAAFTFDGVPFEVVAGDDSSGDPLDLEGDVVVDGPAGEMGRS